MIRNNVRRTAEALGYNLMDLVRGTGISRPALHRIWHNQTEQISFETLDKLCNFLKVPINDLIEHVPDDEMTPEDIEHLVQRHQANARYNAKRRKSNQQ